MVGGWSVAFDGKFSQRTFESAEAAAEAFDTDQIQWIDPCKWKAAKHGGCYRQAPGRGTLSVKQAKSGSWFWTSSLGGGAHGWFDTLEEARAAADAPRLAPDTEDDDALADMLSGFA